MKTYYKIVKKENGGLFSYASGHLPINWAVEYKVGEFTKPKHPKSKIFIFKTKKAARKFFLLDRSLSSDIAIHGVFQCHAVGVSKITYRSRSMNELKDHWEYKPFTDIVAGVVVKHTIPPFAVPAPEGSLGATKIKLLKEVQI